MSVSVLNDRVCPAALAPLVESLWLSVRPLFVTFTTQPARDRLDPAGRPRFFRRMLIKIRSHLPTTGRANRTQQRIQKQVTDKTQLFLHRLVLFSCPV